MVAALVESLGIRTRAIETAFQAVLRHDFLPESPLAEVYSGHAIPTRFGPRGPISSSSEPSIMALMLEQLDVHIGHRVLEIGAGTGYNAALLAHLAGPQGSVVTADIDADITADARRHLAAVGATNVIVVTADGWAGEPEHGPYDRIEATVGVWDLSTAWVNQLSPGGRLVVPLWLRNGIEVSIAVEVQESWLESVSIEPCGFMRLRGHGAGPEVHHEMGDWTASLDDGHSDKVVLLAELLEQIPVLAPAPLLAPGWFTTIGLADPGAVTLHSLVNGRTQYRSGIIDLETRTLALLEDHCYPGAEIAAASVQTYGGDTAKLRLLDLIARTPPVPVDRLRVKAFPAGQ